MKFDLKMLHRMCDALNVAVLVLDAGEGTILYANRPVYSDVDRAPEDLLGKRYHEVFWPDFTTLYEELVQDCEDGMPHTSVYYWVERRMWEQVSGQRMDTGQGRTLILLSITNITEVSRSEYKYRQLALYDRQLELPNGHKLEADIAALSDYRRTALFHMSIDRLSSINDLYGWDTGDYLLEQVRDWLTQQLRKTSQLYRVGTHEFCLLVRDISLPDAKARAAQLLERFKQPWELPSKDKEFPLYCTITLGVVYGKYVKGDMRNLLYRTINAPEVTVDGYSLYDEAMDAQIKRQMRLRQILINCIQQGMKGFSVHYQPIVDAKTGQWTGAEALCRWVTPEGESIPPMVFIQEAEQMGMIARLDAWVRQQAMQKCRAWGLHEKSFLLDINVSPAQPVNQGLVDKILAQIEEADYPKHCLNLEITESSKVSFTGEILDYLHRLKAEGLRISLDDFGTGYASFDNLVKLPAKALKTEMSFIRDLEHNEYLQYLLKMMVDLAHKVGMVLIAEGVETQTQWELLRSYGVDFMQGYLFGKPMPAEAFEKELHRYADAR